MSIEEGNKIIAEFMGWIHHEDKNYDAHEMATLKYHTSWDWLMPVVQKIINTDYGMNTYQLYVCDSLGYADITKVWLEVTTFIQWYNTQSVKQ